MSNLFDALFGRDGSLTNGNEILARQRAAQAEQLYNQRMGQFAQAMADQNHQLVGGLGQALGPGAIMAVDPAQGRLHIQQSHRSLGGGDFWRQFLTESYQPNMFNRWMDIRESEDELQEFLAKCVTYGAKMQRPTNMSMKELEK
jgi:hypothetical protein